MIKNIRQVGNLRKPFLTIKMFEAHKSDPKVYPGKPVDPCMIKHLLVLLPHIPAEGLETPAFHGTLFDIVDTLDHILESGVELRHDVLRYQSLPV